MMKNRLALCGVLLSLVATTQAHEFWLEPSHHRVAPKSAFQLEIYVGEHFNGELREFLPSRTRSFTLHSEQGKTKVVGRAGAKSSFARTQDAGCYVAAYESELSYIEIPAEKFTKYLKAEGLDAIVAERAQRGESDAVGRERYFRCAKSLICAGDDTKLADRDVGLPLEITIATKHDSDSKNDSKHSIDVTVELRDKPLANAQVVAVRKGDADSRIVARSDERGRVQFELETTGVWLVTTIHMEEVKDDPKAVWQSIWASTTFSLSANAPERTEERHE